MFLAEDEEMRHWGVFMLSSGMECDKRPSTVVQPLQLFVTVLDMISEPVSM